MSQAKTARAHNMRRVQACKNIDSKRHLDENLPVSEAKVASSLFDNLVWMTSAEAAEYLRKSTNALRIAVCRGEIRARKFRRRLYFRKMELDRLLETSQFIGGRKWR